MEQMYHQGECLTSSNSSSSTWLMGRGRTLMGLTPAMDTQAPIWALRELPKGLRMMRGQGSLWSMAGHTAPIDSK